MDDQVTTKHGRLIKRGRCLIEEGASPLDAYVLRRALYGLPPRVERGGEELRPLDAATRAALWGEG